MKKKKNQKKKATSKSRVSAKAKLRAKSAAKGKSAKKKAASPRARVAPMGRIRESQDVMENAGVRKVPMSAVRPKARSARVGGGAGDYEGISRVESVDSESPEELLEEGNAFEAGIVEGVQNAPNANRGEVRTREVPEDDVPTEYDDQDRP
ncbi:MAG TPA: hypothetical protein VFR42_03295 [Candidatus Acidoferrum sp.]|nr:hypothetical protein [Candidatus Acidoferrum sp.]